VTAAGREQLAQWRKQCADGTITLADYANAIAALREDRFAARPRPKRLTIKAAREHLAGCLGGCDYDHAELAAACAPRRKVKPVGQQLDLVNQIMT